VRAWFLVSRNAQQHVHVVLYSSCEEELISNPLNTSDLTRKKYARQIGVISIYFNDTTCKMIKKVTQTLSLPRVLKRGCPASQKVGMSGGGLSVEKFCGTCWGGYMPYTRTTSRTLTKPWCIFCQNPLYTCMLTLQVFVALVSQKNWTSLILCVFINVTKFRVTTYSLTRCHNISAILQRSPNLLIIIIFLTLGRYVPEGV